MNIAVAFAVGLPFKIDPVTVNMYQGLYARILVDVDGSKRMSERILASLKNEKKISMLVSLLR